MTTTKHLDNSVPDDKTDYVKINEELKPRRKVGRPKGSKNGNWEYKEKKRKEEKARKELWSRGQISWKLDSNQKILYNAYKNRTAMTLIWMTSRQIGKTWTVCTIAIEECMKVPNFRIAYVCPKQKQSKNVVRAKMIELMVDCPVELRAKFRSQDNVWEFPNGSEIHCCGSDGGNIETLRGNKYNIVIVDEFAFLDDFDYALNSVLFPTMTTIEKPLLLMISSPPKTHGHPSNDWIDRAEANDSLIVKTIYDCPRFNDMKIQKILSDQFNGDKNNIHFRREYLCERIPDITSLVLPEATSTKMLEITETDYERPDYFIPIVAADWGVQDNNGILFGHYNFLSAKIVIEDEILLAGYNHTTENIRDAIREKEIELWGEDKKIIRYCDNNLQLINDLSLTYGLDFMPTAKDNLHAAVNEVRMRISKCELSINDKCKHLKTQMKSTLWDRNRKQFKKIRQTNIDISSATNNSAGHSDLVAALVYLVRNIDTFNNPFPADYEIPSHFFKSPKMQTKMKMKTESSFEQSMKKAFSLTKRR